MPAYQAPPMEVQTGDVVVDVDEEAMADAVERLRGEVMDGTKCPTCGGSARIQVHSEPRETDTTKRSVLLVAWCTATDPCGWQHRLLAGSGEVIHGGHP